MRKVNRWWRHLFRPSNLGTYLLPITWNFHRFRQGHFFRNPQFPIKGQYYLGTSTYIIFFSLSGLLPLHFPCRRNLFEGSNNVETNDFGLTESI